MSINYPNFDLSSPEELVHFKSVFCFISFRSWVFLKNEKTLFEIIESGEIMKPPQSKFPPDSDRRERLTLSEWSSDRLSYQIGLKRFSIFFLLPNLCVILLNFFLFIELFFCKFYAIPYHFSFLFHLVLLGFFLSNIFYISSYSVRFKYHMFLFAFSYVFRLFFPFFSFFSLFVFLSFFLSLSSGRLKTIP